ncbi:hypothetical protein Tco_0663473 [Tanacetum coccineum]
MSLFSPPIDILPIEVEPVEVMFNDSHTYGENISQVEREFLSMVDELLNLSNDDETFDPGGGENDVLLNNGENNDLNVFTLQTFLPVVTNPEVLPASYSTGSEDKVFKPGIFDDELERKSSLTLDTFIHPTPPIIHYSSLVWGQEPKWEAIWRIQSEWTYNLTRWSPTRSSTYWCLTIVPAPRKQLDFLSSMDKENKLEMAEYYKLKLHPQSWSIFPDKHLQAYSIRQALLREIWEQCRTTYDKDREDSTTPEGKICLMSTQHSCHWKRVHS